ncbi:mediator-associated protein 2 [Lolium rigidum]|uniref:mediator-associated protein 2 n=1 Tax=Lolium rigidum TaxID=89674 RepID=UPI001F5D9040|nr:mediator-associated protein 2 [Lolium rigidum]
MVRKATRYEPGPAFQESGEEDMLEISPSDSTELWLIQWPINHVDASDFHGKEVSLKLHKDGNLGNLESFSGKSYELVSFAAQQPDATVFLPSGSEMKAVGKISRRVSLVRYPEPQELEKEKPGFGSLMTPGSKKSAGSSRKTMSRFTSASKNRSSQGSAFSLGQHSAEPVSKHKQKKRRDESSLGHSNMSGKSSQGSQARGTESNTTSKIPQPSVEKSKKKKKVRIAE